MKYEVLATFPSDDNFYMPAEFEKHSGCWLLWPERGDIWPMNAIPAQKFFFSFIHVLCEYEHVTIGVSPKNYQDIKKKISSKIRVIEINYNDIWIRDTGPIFLINKAKNELRAVSWEFNAWGGGG